MYVILELFDNIKIVLGVLDEAKPLRGIAAVHVAKLDVPFKMCHCVLVPLYF